MTDSAQWVSFFRYTPASPYLTTDARIVKEALRNYKRTLEAERDHPAVTRKIEPDYYERRIKRLDALVKDLELEVARIQEGME